MVKLSWRIWVLIIALILSLLAIKPSFESGVMIKSVDKNSSAFEAGLRAGQVIKLIDGQEIATFEDYAKALEKFPTDERVKLIILTKEQEHILFTNEDPKMTVGKIPPTRIKFGLDIEGGARALVKPEQDVSGEEINDLIAVTSERLNVYGLTEVVIRPVSDLAGNNYMLVEIAGATPTELQELLSKQGKFEAKIGNNTVFTGGKQDIAAVCRNDASCSGIESCFAVEGGEACRFRFAVYLSEEAAKKHAEITSNLSVNVTEQGRYLEEKLDLYLDDVLVDSLFISEELKGRVTTQISIQGSGTGPTRDEAFENAESEMQKLQTVLITGSLPYKLEIVKLDTISPVLGGRFIYSILIAGIVAITAVALIILIRYRKFKSSMALLLTSFSEVIIILGIASLIKWNLDLPSIAGILAVIGTGVDQQIVILDESRKKELSVKERLKRALFIVISAYFTSLVSLLPLYWAGAGLLKGFAVTTIIGITSAVLITRPAFADIIRKIEK